jgi:nicotinate-nucleotide adenylyltransferase
MIGLFGGSFDPIHNGHLRVALEAQQRLGLSQVRFIPCHTHAFAKPIQATAAQRLAILKLAISGEPHFHVEPHEIEQHNVSYTIDTVITLKHKFPTEKLALLIGVDAFVALPKWHRWQEIIDYASIIVLHRPGYTIPVAGEVIDYLKEHECHDAKTFTEQSPSGIYLLSLPMLEISSTYIRHSIRDGKNAKYLLPDAALNYIHEQKIYQTD